MPNPNGGNGASHAKYSSTSNAFDTQLNPNAKWANPNEKPMKKARLRLSVRVNKNPNPPNPTNNAGKNPYGGRDNTAAAPKKNA